MLVLSEFEFIGQEGFFLLPTESVLGLILVDFFLVEGLENFDLIFVDFLDPAEAESGEEVEIGGVGVFGVEFGDEISNVLLLYLF